MPRRDVRPRISKMNTHNSKIVWTLMGLIIMIDYDNHLLIPNHSNHSNHTHHSSRHSEILHPFLIRGIRVIRRIRDSDNFPQQIVWTMIFLIIMIDYDNHILFPNHSNHKNHTHHSSDNFPNHSNHLICLITVPDSCLNFDFSDYYDRLW